MGIVIDTSVLIAVERKRLAWDDLVASWPQERPFISAITLSELWHGCHRASGSLLANRLKFVQQMESRIPVLGFNTSEALVHAKINAQMAEAGATIGPLDLIIAATALAHGHSVATLNVREFSKIPRLTLTDVRPFLLSK